MAGQRRVAVTMGIGEAYKRHTLIFAGIHNYARQQDHWRLILDEWADHTLPSRAGSPVAYDGWIGRISPQGARRALALGLPTVNVWFASPAAGRLPGVFPDYDAAGRLRAEHLLARGFRNLGVAHIPSHVASAVQADAFELAARQAGCHSVRRVHLFTETQARGRGPVSFRDWRRTVRSLERWLDTLSPPVGLFIDEIDSARLIIELCRNRGWRVPEDVAIVAGTNEETICERPEPGITSLELPYEQIGFEAARMLDELMDAGSPARLAAGERRRRILLPPLGIVARRSTDFHAVDDPTVRRALRFIDENLHRDIVIDSVAEAALVSRRTLTQLFRTRVGRSIAEEIRRLRLERVKRELATTDRPIHQVARQAGFGSTRTLNEAFLAAVGCSPRAYRRTWTPATSVPRP